MVDKILFKLRFDVDNENLYSLANEIFGESEEGYSKRMLLYLSKLSNFQKEILKLTIAGYAPDEVKKELHINERQYSNCNAAIYSYRNISFLVKKIIRSYI